MKKHIDEVKMNSSKLPFEASRQKGEKGHCLAAQIFDGSEDGLSIARMETDNAELATYNAALIAHCVNTHQMLLDALKRSNAKLELYHETRTGFVGDADDIEENRNAIEAAECIEIKEDI